MASWHCVLPGMEVRLPKFIRIENTRLRVFQAVLQIAVVVALVYQFFWVENGNLVVQKPEGDAINWADAPDDKTFSEAISEDFKKEFCKFPEKVAYNYSPGWTYENFKCLVMSSNEMSFKIGIDIIYFPTYFHEEWEESAVDKTSTSTTCKDTIQAVAPRKCVSGQAPTGSKCHSTMPCSPGEGCYQKCSWKYRKHFFTVGIEEMMMKFTNKYLVQTPAGDKTHRGADWVETPPPPEVSPSGDQPNCSEMSANDDKCPMLTVIEIESSDGSSNQEFDCGRPKKGYCRFQAGSFVALRVGDWLRAAGFNLDTENSAMGDNQWTIRRGTALKKKPIFRITGADIELSLRYISSNLHNGFEDPPNSGIAWKWTLCKISVRGKANWTGMPVNRFDKLGEAGGTSGSKMRYRFYEGVRFKFTTSTASEFGYWSAAAIITTLTSIIVFFGFTAQIVASLAIYLLGNTSRTYRRAAQEPLQVRQIATESLPSKLVQSAAAFYMLSSLERMGEKGISMMKETDAKGISRDTFQLVMEHAFRSHSNLDQTEIDLMTEHAFRKLGENKSTISLSSFCKAVASNEAFDMTAMVSSFDVDRKRGILEVVFDDGTSKPKQLATTEKVYEYRFGGLQRKVKEVVEIRGSKNSVISKGKGSVLSAKDPEQEIINLDNNTTASLHKIQDSAGAASNDEDMFKKEE